MTIALTPAFSTDAVQTLDRSKLSQRTLITVLRFTDSATESTDGLQFPEVAIATYHDNSRKQYMHTVRRQLFAHRPGGFAVTKTVLFDESIFANTVTQAARYSETRMRAAHDQYVATVIAAVSLEDLEAYAVATPDN